MKQYKAEVDALHASDTLKARIAALPRKTTRPKKFVGRRFAAVAAVIASVLLVGAVISPLLFGYQKSADNCSPAYGYEYAADYPGDGFLSDSAKSAAPQEAAASADAMYGGVEANGASAAQSALPAGRKLIRNAELDVQTKTFDDFCTAVRQKTAALSGYEESSESGAYSNDTRYATIVLRIPASRLDAFLQSVSELGTVTSQSTSMQDVTDEYIDIESRLAALETEQETLLALMKKSDKLTDTLEIQDRLAEVRGRLESLKGQLKALESQVDYSKVTLSVTEVQRVTLPESRSFWTQVRQNLSDNLYSIGQGLRSFAINLLSALPYLALVLIPAAVIVAIVVLVRKKRKS